MSNTKDLLEDGESRAAIEAQLKREALKNRLWISLMFVLSGLAMGAYFMGWPLYQALNDAPEVSVSLKFSGFSVMIIFFGLATACGMNFLTDTQNISFKDFIIMAVFVVIAFATWWAFKMTMESFGYRFPEFS